MVEERIIKFDERTEKKHSPADFSKTAQILSNSIENLYAVTYGAPI
jgi:hypothetical protein